MIRSFSFLAATLATIIASAQQRFTYTRPKMGSPFTIIFYHHADSNNARQLADHCFALVDSFVNIYSDYIDNSELNRLGRSSGQGIYVQVSPALYDIIVLSQKATKASDGAFDITIGPLVRLWRNARKQNRFPHTDEIKAAREKTGFKNLRIDTAARSIMLIKPGMLLDLGGIAQGYIGQRILERLRHHGATSALVDVSGDIAIGDPPPGLGGWRIEINAPRQTEAVLDKKLLLHNCAVSTSGDVYQFIEHKGKRYSHIIDPRTGFGVSSQRNVTVIAPDAATADWLATACSILRPRKALRLAKRWNAKILIGTIRKGKLHFFQTKGFGTTSR